MIRGTNNRKQNDANEILNSTLYLNLSETRVAKCPNFRNIGIATCRTNENSYASRGLIISSAKTHPPTEPIHQQNFISSALPHIGTWSVPISFIIKGEAHLTPPEKKTNGKIRTIAIILENVLPKSFILLCQKLPTYFINLGAFSAESHNHVHGNHRKEAYTDNS